MLLKKLAQPHFAAFIAFSIFSVPALPHVFHELLHGFSAGHSGDHHDHPDMSSHHHDDETHPVVPLNELPNAYLKTGKVRAEADFFPVSITGLSAVSFELSSTAGEGRPSTGPPLEALVPPRVFSHPAHAPPLK